MSNHSEHSRSVSVSEDKLEEELRKTDPRLKENKIILLTVLNPIYSLNVDVIHRICKSSGKVQKIVMFERGQVIHALVQFEEVGAAITAKTNLHGANIYPNCCTLKVEFAKQEMLNVKTNNDRTWDFTVGATSNGKVGQENSEAKKTQTARKVLIDEVPPSHVNGIHQEGFGNNDTSHNSVFVNSRHGVMPSVRMDPERQGYQQRSPVLIVYNLDTEKFNCQKLFNLMSLYGNVNKINFIRSKEGCAMVEFASSQSSHEALKLLNNIFIFGNRINVEESRKIFVEEIRSPYDLPSGDKSFENFIGDRNNRFNSPHQASKNRLLPPNKILHFYNVPKMEDDAMMDIFCDANAPFPTKVTWFDLKSLRGSSATGLIEFETVEEATEALVIVNNTEIEGTEENARPYTMKLCFARS